MFTERCLTSSGGKEENAIQMLTRTRHAHRLSRRRSTFSRLTIISAFSYGPEKDPDRSASRTPQERPATPASSQYPSPYPARVLISTTRLAGLPNTMLASAATCGATITLAPAHQLAW